MPHASSTSSYKLPESKAGSSLIILPFDNIPTLREAVRLAPQLIKRNDSHELKARKIYMTLSLSIKALLISLGLSRMVSLVMNSKSTD